MAVTQNSYTGNGSTTNYSFTFPYLKQSDIKCQLDSTVTTAFSLANATTVAFDTAPGNNVKIKIYRETDTDSAPATFYAGSSVKSEDLNDNFTQTLYTSQEVQARYLSNLAGTMVGDLTMGEDTSIIFEGATDDAHETTLSVTDPTADRTITLPNATGTVPVLAVHSDTAITSTPAELNYSDGVTSNIQTQLNAKQASDAELTELATMASTTAEALADLTQAEVQILDGATVTTAQLNRVDATSSIQTQLDAKQALDAELTELATMGSTTAAALADLTESEVQILDGATVTTAQLNRVDATSNIQGQIDGKQPIDADLTDLSSCQTGAAAKLALLTADEVEKIDGLTSSTAELNKLDGVTASATDLNITASMTKQTTISDTDSSYPTSGAVVDYVASALQPFGGFEAVADEDSFPTTQPASGVVISINDASGVVINGSGVSTTARTTGNGSDNVTINGFPSSLYSTTLSAGNGLQVSSTGSSNTYTYHKLLASESDVKQLSDDINDFNSRYRIASSAPGSNNDEGDLYFDTASNKMYVYDGSAWGEVTSTGDFKYLVLTEAGTTNAASYDGSKVSFDLKENTTGGSAASVTNAAQLMVSINGVIQKPNTGTNTSGLDGFVMTDADTIKFTAGVPTGANVFVIQSGSALSINAPGDSTVTEAKLNLTGGSNGEFLKKDSTAAGGFVWGAVPAGVGGGTGVDFNDEVKARWGGGGDLEIYHQSGVPGINHIQTNAASTVGLYITTHGGNIQLRHGTSGKEFIFCDGVTDKNVELYQNGNKKLETTSTGITVTGTVAATSYTGDGSSLTGVASATADGCIYENDQTISNNYTIASGKGAHSVGPITVNATVTVNGNWVVS